MAELFGTQRQAITKHLRNIFTSNELEKESTSSILELVRQEGNRMVKRSVELYNLDVIISVGFRINTKRGIQFLQWANRVLKEYMLRGYAVNNRLNLIEEKFDRRLSKTEQEVEKLNEKMDFFIKTNLPPYQGIKV